MDQIVLSLRECSDGWRVFQAESPLFWSPTYGMAMDSARCLAALHVDLREVPAVILMQLLGEAPVEVTRLAPGH